ncbi:hypothetical protein HMPREF3034_00408 [Prevotella sp. DNF00663]|nr:hypothetical protein HMPREF3034_00408 [Prevotella sp. DNF00663]
MGKVRLLENKNQDLQTTLVIICTYLELIIRHLDEDVNYCFRIAWMQFFYFLYLPMKFITKSKCRHEKGFIVDVYGAVWLLGL